MYLTKDKFFEQRTHLFVISGTPLNHRSIHNIPYPKWFARMLGVSGTAIPFKVEPTGVKLFGTPLLFVLYLSSLVRDWCQMARSLSSSTERILAQKGNEQEVQPFSYFLFFSRENYTSGRAKDRRKAHRKEKEFPLAARIFLTNIRKWRIEG